MNTKTLSLVLATALLAGCSDDWCKTKKSCKPDHKVVVAKDDTVVYFGYGSSKLDDQAKAKIAQAAAILKARAARGDLVAPVVTGHCSQEGSVAANNRVAAHRAKAVANELQRQSGYKAQTASYGKNIDFGTGATHNRRAVIHADGNTSDLGSKPVVLVKAPAKTIVTTTTASEEVIVE